MFVQAVAFLYSRQAHRTDAVHFAIALAYYGLIKVPDSSRLAEMDYRTPCLPLLLEIAYGPPLTVQSQRTWTPKATKSAD